MNPSSRGDLGNQVLRILDIVLQNRDHRSVLLREELLRYRTAFLAHTYLLGMKQETLDVTRWIATLHEGNRKKGAGLWADLAAIVLKSNLITKNRIGINGGIVESKSLTRVEEQLICGNGVHAGSFGNQIGSLITTRANRLRIKRLDSTKVISGMS